MKTYKIIWHSIILGESKVHAKNKREAKSKAYDNLDYDWKKFNLNTKWLIRKIEEASDEAPR